MNSKPFFSIVIPTYNRMEILKEALNSVFAQSFEDYEIIIVDDHSNDGTKEMLQSISDRRLKYLKNTRKKGGGGARNTGIFAANGKWTAFLDDDDIWLENKLEQFHQKIIKLNNETKLIYSGFTYYDFQKKIEKKTTEPRIKGEVLEDLLYTNWIGTYSVVAVETSLLIELNGLDESFSSYQDLELYVRIAQKVKVDYISTSLTMYRIDNTDNISKSYVKKLEGNLAFYNKYKYDINKNKKLRQRHNAQIFLNAIKAKKTKTAFKALPWTLSGVLIDPKNFIFTIMQLIKR